ncbi:UDP-glycosyltransferase 88A1 [Striga hermonthica]|uniref:Glycosyltransferase n=1 Tax=Striga hermonthica TaxID=68872 RepID=A0A9N7R4B0_STRHE|nr:UDP-glycosyltransferase 88A1 [Striga hermonthica]
METIVLYPSPGMGHLISMVELGKLILRHHPSAAVTILTAPPSFNTGSTAAYIRRVSSALPSITFHHMPAVNLDLQAFPSMEAVIFETLRLSSPHVRRALESISAVGPTISAFIIDFFCASSQPIAAELGIPTYYFGTSGAASLALCLHFPAVHRSTTVSFKDMKNTLLNFPGLPPFPPSDVPLPLLDRESSDYRKFLECSLGVSCSDGIIINTFESLEVRSLKSIREGECNTGGPAPPPVFTIGPLLASEERSTSGPAHECLSWLDKQPSKSVVYLCFGSLGLFSEAQLKEIAIGLEKSGHRFLWVVRSPPSGDDSARFLPPPEPELDSLLPEGFLDRTAGRGLVVKSWAPQVAVLGHRSVGGFVTHCGWNSVLEAVRASVPMVAWPLYVEQKANRAVLVEEMRVALRIEMAEDGFVAAEEVERRVNELMGEAEEVRRVVEEKSLEAMAAMAEGGSSIVELGKLFQSWKKV